jgi:hypothetical protein
MTLRLTTICIECHYAEFRVLIFVMLNTIILSVIMLNVVMLSVVAPKSPFHLYDKVPPGKSFGRERLSTIDLLVLVTSLNLLLLKLKILFSFFVQQATLMRRSTVLSIPS